MSNSKINESKKQYVVQYNVSRITREEKAKILSSFPVFVGADKEEVLQFAENMRPKVIKPMEVFVEEGLDEYQAFFMYKGSASLFRTTSEGEIVNIEVLGAPEIVGEMGLIDQQISPVSAVAISETHALTISQESYCELIEKNPHFSNRLLKVFSSRIRYFDNYVEELVSSNLYERTWNMLQYLSRVFPNREIIMSHEELDNLIWGSRSRITEVLNQMQREGKVKLSHRKIKLL